MSPEQEQKLFETLGRIDGRTEQMEKNHDREIDGVHARITDVRAEAAQDVQDLRGEVKRLSGLLSAGVSAVVAGGMKFFGIGGS